MRPSVVLLIAALAAMPGPQIQADAPAERHQRSTATGPADGHDARASRQPAVRRPRNQRPRRPSGPSARPPRRPRGDTDAPAGGTAAATPSPAQPESPAAASSEPLTTPVLLFDRLNPDADLHVENWIGAPGGAASNLRRATAPVLVIFSGELSPAAAVAQAKAARGIRHLVAVADEIRIAEPVEIDLSGQDFVGRPGHSPRRSAQHWRDARAGGHLVLLARRATCEANGGLRLISRGGKGPDKITRNGTLLASADTRAKGYAAGDGGVLFMAAEQFIIAEKEVTPEEFVERGCLGTASPGGPAGHSSAAGSTGGVRAVQGIRTAIAELPSLGPHLVSRWVLESLTYAIAQVRSDTLARGRVEAVRSLQRVIELTDINRYPVLPADRERHQQHLDSVAALRQELSQSLWQDSLTVSVGGSMPRRVDLFTAGTDLHTRMAPTDLLIKRRLTAGRHVLGLIELDRERPDRLRLELEAELAADPWIESQVAHELSKRGETYGGVFRDWVLTGREIAHPGVLESRIDVAPSRNDVRISLTLETGRATLLLARLASSGGLPLTFDWESAQDRNLRGTWNGPALTLLKRADSPLVLGEDARVRNTGTVEVSLEYLKVGDQYIPLSNAVEIGPGDELTVPLPAGADVREATIPAAAVIATGFDPFRFEEDFHVVGGDELVEEVTITNRIGHDERYGGGLEAVEIQITFAIDEGADRYEVTAGPYALAPAGARGSHVTVSFLKPRRGQRQVRVSGTAFFEGGSRQSLQPVISSELSIHLTSDHLAEHGRHR